jgi:hypothetical protein
MPKIYDEQTDYTAAGDNNQNTAASIQPIAGGENLWQAVLNRTAENLRKRTEVLRQVTDDLRYFADYDRVLLCRAENTTFTFTNQPDGHVLAMTGGPLWVYPALTPGRLSGGRTRGARMFVQNGLYWLPYAGTLGVNDLSFVATAQFTGMRGYEDCENFDTVGSGFSLGGNRLQITLVANPAVAGGVISATVTGAPETLITITYGTLTPTYISQIIAYIASDTTSQGGYGLAHMIRGVTTLTAGPASTTVPPTITNAMFQGGYDAEAHQITAVQLTTFFNALDSVVYHNRLQEGESLAISFVAGPVERGSGIMQGGRRQSLFDLPTGRTGTTMDNTPSLNIFNTGREPEKIPGSVPIGKMIDGKFVFIDGTVVGPSAISLGESAITLGRLAAYSAPSGASLVGYAGSGPFHADAAVAPGPLGATSSLAAGGLETVLDAFVSALADATINQSGARRIGGESLAATVSTGNGSNQLPLSAGSLRQQLNQVLNGTYAGRPVGVNGRVNEWGHQLHNFDPLIKNLAETTPEDLSGGGARFIHGHSTAGPQGTPFITSPTTGFDRPRVLSDIFVEKLSWSASGTSTLNDNWIYDTPYDQSASPNPTDLLFLTGTSVPQMTAVRARLKTGLRNTSYGVGSESYLLLVYVDGSGSSIDGWYYLYDIDTAQQALQLVNLDGSQANVHNNGSGVVNIYAGVMIGDEKAGQKLRAFHFTSSAVPLIDIGVWRQSQMIMQFWDPNAWGPTVGTPVAPGACFYSDNAVWLPAGAAPRSTDNILVTGDKVLLDGVETGTAVDATASHHHGDTYASFTPTIPPIDNTNNWSSISTAVGPPPGTPFPVTAPAGFLAVGVLIYYEIELIPLAAGAVTGVLAVTDKNAAILMKFEYVYTATGAGDKRTSIGQMFVPLQELTPGGGGEFYFWRVPSINVDIGGSTWLLKYIAKSLVPV